MDRIGLDMMVISVITPATQTLRRTKRFRLPDKRTIGDLGFTGGMIHGRTRDPVPRQTDSCD